MATLQITDSVPFARDLGGGSQKLGRGTIAELIAFAPVTNIIDNLLSTSSVDGLSANMGRVLNEALQAAISAMDALGTAEHEADNTGDLILLTDIVQGDKVFVADASGDATVTTGWAIYRAAVDNPTAINPLTGYRKIAEGESLDVVGAATDLMWIPGGETQGTINNTNGMNAVIPVVSATNAGLMSPSHRAILQFLNVTAITDLDDIRQKAHPAASTAGTAATNPVQINAATQEISFSILDLQEM